MSTTVPEHPARCVLLSDFNVSNLAGYLRRDPAFSSWVIDETDFGQVITLLLDATHDVWQYPTNLAIIWSRPEAIIQSFSRVLDGHSAPIDQLLSEVDAFAGMIAALATRVRSVMVPTWTIDTMSRGLGILDLRPGGHAYALSRMNQRLADQLAKKSNVFMLDASRWLSIAGVAGVSPRYWYLSKSPFGLPVFARAAKEIRTLIDAVEGRAKKLLILDLDDTLWGGIVGETGWAGLRLGGHDAVGEAFKDFQRALKALQCRGVILAIVSKNDEAVALEAIDKHPEMLLRREDFAGWRINWRDKAQNIFELVQELNLGLDAAVFIDDSPAERGRVSEALPQILVPDWPAESMEYRRALEALSCFDSLSISDEDISRTNSYVAQRKSAADRSSVTLDEWVKSLDLTVKVAELSASNVHRVAQLLNKTNQMNLTTRRLTEQELIAWTTDKRNQLWALSVKDRYADHGLTAIVSVQSSRDECRILDFVLSCRVFGRNIEAAMLELAREEAQRCAAPRLSAEYFKTEKNAPTLEFLENRSGGRRPSPLSTTFYWAPNEGLGWPAHIQRV